MLAVIANQLRRYALVTNGAGNFLNLASWFRCTRWQFSLRVVVGCRDGIGWLGLLVGVLAGWLGLLSPASSVISAISNIGFIGFFIFMLSMGIACSGGGQELTGYIRHQRQNGADNWRRTHPTLKPKVASRLCWLTVSMSSVDIAPESGFITGSK